MTVRIKFKIFNVFSYAYEEYDSWNNQPRFWVMNCNWTTNLDQVSFDHWKFKVSMLTVSGWIWIVTNMCLKKSMKQLWKCFFPFNTQCPEKVMMLISLRVQISSSIIIQHSSCYLGYFYSKDMYTQRHSVVISLVLVRCT